MKIWFPNIRTGSGSDIYVERLSKELRKRGVEVVVSWFKHLHELYPVFLKRVQAPSNVDVIHANSWSAYAFKRSGIPLVVTMHHVVHDELYAPYRNPVQAAYHRLLIRNYEKKGIKAAAKVVAVSNYTAAVTKRLFDTDKVVAIHNGIDIDRFSPGFANEFDNQKFNLLFVGNASRRKGFDFLMQAMEELGSGYRLYFTDSPGFFGPSVTKNSECIGKLSEDQLVNAYRSSDVFVFPSRYEGFGYVVAEAMACGKPVVAARTSSLPELIESKKNGFLCAAENIDEFVLAIRQLSSDKELAKDIGNRARKTIVEHFTIDKMVDKYLELYKSIT